MSHPKQGETSHSGVPRCREADLVPLRCSLGLSGQPVAACHRGQWRLLGGVPSVPERDADAWLVILRVPGTSNYPTSLCVSEDRVYLCLLVLLGTRKLPYFHLPFRICVFLFFQFGSNPHGQLLTE